MRKIRLLVDVDDTINKMSRETMIEANRRFGDNFDPDSSEGFNTWDLHTVSKGGMDIYKIWDEPGFFNRVSLMDGVLDVLPRLHEQGYEIYAVTATLINNETRNSGNVYDKFEWLNRHFPFIDKDHYIVCHNKFIIQGDILVDDNSERNLKQWKEHHPNGLAIAIARGHNKDWPEHYRARNWYDVEQIIGHWFRYHAMPFFMEIKQVKNARKDGTLNGKNRKKS